MLTIDVQSILNSIPNQVEWQDIVQFEQLEQLISLKKE